MYWFDGYRHYKLALYKPTNRCAWRLSKEPRFDFHTFQEKLESLRLLLMGINKGTRSQFQFSGTKALFLPLPN